MNKERIEQIARECGLLQEIWVGKLGGPSPCVTIPENLSLEQFKFAQAIHNEALDEACKAVYGNCESDNVAQRTVDAIRKMKV